MDKAYGGVGGAKLGKAGERRFAQRTGRASDMREIEPGVFELRVRGVRFRVRGI
jgi:hypothetical protein